MVVYHAILEIRDQLQRVKNIEFTDKIDEGTQGETRSQWLGERALIVEPQIFAGPFQDWARSRSNAE